MQLSSTSDFSVKIVVIFTLVLSATGEQVQFSPAGKLFSVDNVVNVRVQLRLQPLVQSCQQWRSLVQDNSSKMLSLLSHEGISRVNATIEHSCALVHSFPGVAKLPFEGRTRKPRQLLSTVASFSLGSIFGSFTEKLFGHSDFHDVELQVHRMENQLSALQQHVAQAEKTIADLQFQTEEISVIVSADFFGTTVNSVAAAIDQLYNRRLPLQIVAGLDEAALFSALSDHAQQHQLRLPFHSFDQIYQLPIVFEPDVATQVLNIRVPIPLVEQEFSLYQLLQKEVVSTWQEEHMIFEIGLEETILAINKNKANFVVFTAEQLATCFRLSDVNFCRLPMLLRNMSDTCVSSLFQGSFAHIDAKCHLRPSSKDWNLVVTPEYLFVGSLIPLTVHEKCHNASRVYHIEHPQQLMISINPRKISL
jgi:hypothetical protein